MYIKAPNETSAESAQCHEDTATHWRKPESEILKAKRRTMRYWETDSEYLFSSIHSTVTQILNRGFQNTGNCTNSSFSTAVQVRLLLYHPRTPWWSTGAVWEKWQYREQTCTTQEFLSDAMTHLYLFYDCLFLCSTTSFSGWGDKGAATDMPI